MLDNEKLQNFKQALEELQTKSASVEGKAAIFFSGDNGKNFELADDCQKKYPDKSYTINQTDAGKFLNDKKIADAIDSGLITPSQKEQLWNEA